MKKQIKKDLGVINFSVEELFTSLTENEKDELYAACSLIYNNKYFKSICDELGTLAILYIAKEADTEKDLAYGRGMVHGIADVYKKIEEYDSIFKEKTKRKEEFDKNAII